MLYVEPFVIYIIFLGQSDMRKKVPLEQKTAKQLKKIAWDETSLYVRQRHADPHTGLVACYTCGVVMHWKEGDAGHAIPGRHNKVLFDLTILRFQCKHCNGPKSGMQYTFGKKLNQENGEDWFEQKQIEAKGELKLYKSDYLEIIYDMQQRLKDL